MQKRSIGIYAIGILGVMISLSHFYRLTNNISSMPSMTKRDIVRVVSAYACTILLLISSIGIIKLRNWARILFMVLLGIPMVLLLLPVIALALSGQYSLVQLLCKIDKILMILLVYLLIFSFFSVNSVKSQFIENRHR
jgi:Ca2+/Na+ antiporter